MSLFGSSARVICADYFGDELPFPLPWVKETRKKTAVIKSTRVAGNSEGTMSLFGSSASVICADYFGDELPFPLPRVKTETRKKVAEIKSTQAAGNSAAAAEGTQ